MKKRRKRKSIVDFRASFPDEESAIRYYECKMGKWSGFAIR